MLSLVPYSRKDNNLFRMLDDMERSFFNNAVSGASQFRCDIKDKGDHYLIDAELPGFTKDDLSINVEDNVLTVSATNKAENDEKDKEGNYIRRERRYGSYSRSFDVAGVDVDKIKADYKNGILQLTLPKTKEEKPETRKIDIS